MSRWYFVMPEWSAALGKVYRIFYEDPDDPKAGQRATDRVFLDRKTASAAADKLTQAQGEEKPAKEETHALKRAREQETRAL